MTAMPFRRLGCLCYKTWSPVVIIVFDGLGAEDILSSSAGFRIQDDLLGRAVNGAFRVYSPYTSKLRAIVARAYSAAAIPALIRSMGP